MWGRYKKLKNKLNSLEFRINALERPFKLDVGDKVFGYDRYYTYIYDSKVGKFEVVSTYRDDYGYPMYNIYSKKHGVIKKLKYFEIITEKRF